MAQARTPIQNKELGEAAARKEYTRLRNIAQKRLKRLAGSEFAESKEYLINANRFVTLKEMKSPNELYARLSDLQRFINAKSSTVTGQKARRDKAIRTWNEKPGMEWVNKENFKDFIEFLQFMKSMYPNRYALELWQAGEDFTTYKEFRRGGLTGGQLRARFNEYLKRTRPTTRLIDLGPVPVPKEFIKYNDKD